VCGPSVRGYLLSPSPVPVFGRVLVLPNLCVVRQPASGRLARLQRLPLVPRDASAVGRGRESAGDAVAVVPTREPLSGEQDSDDDAVALLRLRLGEGQGDLCASTVPAPVVVRELVHEAGGALAGERVRPLAVLVARHGLALVLARGVQHQRTGGVAVPPVGAEPARDGVAVHAVHREDDLALVQDAPVPQLALRLNPEHGSPFVGGDRPPRHRQRTTGGSGFRKMRLIYYIPVAWGGGVPSLREPRIISLPLRGAPFR